MFFSLLSSPVDLCFKMTLAFITSFLLSFCPCGLQLQQKWISLRLIFLLRVCLRVYLTDFPNTDLSSGILVFQKLQWLSLNQVLNSEGSHYSNPILLPHPYSHSPQSAPAQQNGLTIPQLHANSYCGSCVGFTYSAVPPFSHFHTAHSSKSSSSSTFSMKHFLIYLHCS